MPSLNSFNSITITSGGITTTIDVSNGVSINEVIASGTVTLAGNCSIQPTGTPVPNSHSTIFWRANLILGSYTVNVFGTLLTQEQVQNASSIDCYYNGSSWEINVYVSDVNFPKGVSGTEQITLTNGGGTFYVNPRVNTKKQEIIGSPTLSGNVSILPTGTLIDGDNFEFAYKATAIIGSNTITIFGRTLDAYTSLIGASYIYAAYSTKGGAHWDVWIGNDSLAGGNSDIITTTVLVTPAEIATLYSSPKVLLPKPGVNKTYQIISLMAELNFQSIQYIVSSGNPMVARFNTSETWDYYWDVWFLGATQKTVSPPSQLYYHGSYPPDIVNAEYILTNYSADPTFGGGYLFGDSPIYMTITYRIITTH